MKQTVLATVLLILSSQPMGANSTFESRSGTTEGKGDWLQILLPATALGLTVVLDDKQGTH